jgi:ABC-type sugar transport system permease subunit
MPARAFGVLSVPRILLNFLDQHFAHLAVLPSLIVLIGLVGYPAAQTLILSFQRVRLGETTGDFVGLRNYLTAFSQPQFWNALTNTLVFTAGTLSIELLVSIPIALVLARRFRGTALFRGMVLLPYLLASVVVATIWKWWLHDVVGLMNYILVFMSVIRRPVVWLATQKLTMAVLILISAWTRISVVTLVLVGGLQTIPEEVHEAADVDGANRWQHVFRITLPLLVPYILLALILRTTFAMREFDLVWLLTEGGPLGSTDLISTFTYRTAFTVFEAGHASALSFVLLAVTFAISMVYVRLLAPSR